MPSKEFTSLGDLSRELGLNKSKLLYYAKQGFLKPVMEISGVNIFNRIDVMKILVEMDVLPKKSRKKK